MSYRARFVCLMLALFLGSALGCGPNDCQPCPDPSQLFCSR